jgi:NADPH:quinone reductase-like Zn-dependent oxidoreductase
MDWKIRSGVSQNFRPQSFPYVPGADFAGVIERVGADVTVFDVGQEVFGCVQGTYTQYTLAPVRYITAKPKLLSFDEAATIPVGATTAWQGLFDHGNLQQGQRVLILGGSGGVGLVAVQFARWKGAQVISTTSTPNSDFVRSLGAETIIDYTQERVEDRIHDVDLVLDTVGGEALATVYPTLKREGTLVTIVGQPDEAKACQFGVHVHRFAAQISSELLARFAQLISEGQVKPLVGHTFPLNEAAQAQELSQRGHGRGRIVLYVAEQ